MTDNCSRRDFLAQSAGVVALTAASSTLAWARGSDTPYVDLTELSATAVIAAMKRGDIKAEHYARALRDLAALLAPLNAFRLLTPDAVLEAARGGQGADRGRQARSSPPRRSQGHHIGSRVPPGCRTCSC
jgi:hypothetical protein